jgi:hypothetical protein
MKPSTLLKFLFNALVSLCLVIGLHATAMAQSPVPVPVDVTALEGQVLEDLINPENTSVLQSLAACLPPHSPRAKATRYGLLSTADLTMLDNTISRFFYIQVEYTPVRENQEPPYPWQALLEVNAANQCIPHISAPSITPLEQYIPLETAVGFAEAQYAYLRDYRPEEYQETTSYFTQESRAFEGRAERPGDDIVGCQIFQSNFDALQRMGIVVSSRCQVIPPGQSVRYR